MSFERALFDELEKLAVNLAAGQMHPPQVLEAFKARKAIHKGGRDLSKRIAYNRNNSDTEGQKIRLKNERANLRPAAPKPSTPKPSVWDHMDEHPGIPARKPRRKRDPFLAARSDWINQGHGRAQQWRAKSRYDAGVTD